MTMKKIVTVTLLMVMMVTMFAPGASAHVVLCKYQNGSKGSTVTTIHKRLKAWGYGTTTGNKYTAATEYWVRVFQRANGITETGIVDSVTLFRLKMKKDNVPLKSYAASHGWLIPSMTCYEVSVLQLRLKILGLFHGKINGSFGTLTKNAVKKWQKEHCVVQTGYVAPDMQNALAASVNAVLLARCANTLIDGVLLECGSRVGTKTSKTGAAWVAAMFGKAKVTIPKTMNGLYNCKQCKWLCKFSECRRGDVIIFMDKCYPYKEYAGIYLGNKQIVMANPKTKQVEIVNTANESAYITFSAGMRILPTDGK